jgi:3-hydroxybutyryl-CoA dehydrogenase
MSFRPFDPTRPVAVIGAGVMGAKVAWAAARSGMPTRLYDVSAPALAAAAERILGWSEGAERARVAANLVAADHLDEALAGAQLAFENVPENLELKRTVLADLDARLDPVAFLGSNASALPCSPLAAATGRPERFFNMNWSDPRSSRLVEIMGNPRTDPATIEFALAWARHMGMVPITVRREQMGYSFNRIWRVIKKEVLRQIEAGVATPEDIDRAWMLIFGTPYGPCGLMDQVSLPSVRNVELAYYGETADPTDLPPPFLERMIAEGRTGVPGGEGFYRHPKPAYEDPDWLAR